MKAWWQSLGHTGRFFVPLAGLIAVAVIISLTAAGSSSTPTATTPPDTAATAPVPAVPSGTVTQSFSGNGGKRLGTITVANDSTVEWQNDGAIFQTFDRDFAIGINSQATSGSSDLPAGTYYDVRINAIGNWTIDITTK